MDEKERRSAFLSALTTEHFVLQTAASATVSESAARASIYILSLSSTLVAMGFASQSREAFGPFIASVLPAVFLLGLFTVVRLVDITLEHQRYLTGIAHIRGYYRTLTPEAAEYFAAERGRWPEAPSSPALQLGPNIGLLTTTATMVAFINNIVAGVGVTLLVRWLLGPHRTLVAVFIGVVTAATLVGVFYAYQIWRFGLAQRTAPPPDQTPPRP
jgi:hypothetical protein